MKPETSPFPPRFAQGCSTAPGMFKERERLDPHAPPPAPAICVNISQLWERAGFAGAGSSLSYFQRRELSGKVLLGLSV